MSITELAAIPLWTIGGAGSIVGSLALALSAYADETMFEPDLSRRHVTTWGFVLIACSAPCLLLAVAVSG